MTKDKNMIAGLLKLLEKRSEIKLSYYQDVFYVKFPIHSETLLPLSIFIE